jgi:hypothetical protein
MDAATIQAVAALGAVMVAAAGLLAGFVYWLHRELKQDLLSEIRRVESSSDRANKETREELRRTREELLAEMRRGNAQLLAALNGHIHDTETGAAVFRELPAADDD